MKKTLLVLVFGFSGIISLSAQENNPLIHSGELIEQAAKLHDAGKYKEALDLYRKINRSDTNYVRALFEEAVTLTADSQYKAAIHVCEVALAEKTDADRIPDLLTQYGSLYDNIGDAGRALHIFDSALQLYPAYSPLYLNKATTLLRLKKFSEAEQLFQQVLMADPYNATGHYNLGIAALQTGKLVPATLCFMNYLLVSPQGAYYSNCLSLLNSIANNKDETKQYIDNRAAEPADEYRLAEQIMQSKIALDKNYKPIIELDDPISRQIQVMLEKLPYAEDSKDFWMQYYVPFYKNIFTGGKFEELINHIFPGATNVQQIQNYNKKKKKEIQVMIDEAVAYFNKIRTTRQLNYPLRASTESIYFYENGLFSGKGKLNAAGDKFQGDWIFYFPGGNTKSTGHFNENGEKEGLWTYYFSNDRLKAKLAYANGKQNGPETFYFLNGQVNSEAVYKDDKIEAEGTSYYYAGARNVNAHYNQGKLNGETRRYFSNGSLRTIETYKDDKLDGAYKSYYKNGVLESEATYTMGDAEGPYKAWHPNGTVATEGAYIKNKPAGTWKKYHENGKLKSTETFVNGKEEGDYIEYYDNGQLFTKYVYKKGVVNGEVVYNDDDGKPFSAFVFDDNIVKAVRYMDKTGKEISRSAFKDKKLEQVSYNADGTKKSEAVYNEKGNTEGKETFFYRCGKVSRTSEYSNGELNGPTSYYYLNGKKSSALEYVNDSKDGYYKSFYINGSVETEGWYKENLAQGPWMNYDELGNLTAINYYYNDELDGHKEEFYPNGKKEFDTKYHFGWIEELIQYDTAGKEINHVKMEKGTGKFTGLHLNGKLKFECNYEKGDFEGPYRFYYFDGSKQTVQFYKKGEVDSTYKNYFYGGQLSIDGQYTLGKKAGSWKYYRRNGKISVTEEYTEGEASGHKIYYGANGKIDLDITYEDGARNGPTKKYEPGGTLISQINYKDDLPLSYTYMGKDGKLVPEIPIPAGTGKIKALYADGKTASEYEYKEGKIDGSYKIYYPNGKLFSEREDSYEMTNGPLKEYYDNGQLKASYNYLNDNPHGAYKEYNAKGVVTEEGNYYNGEYHGDIKLYDDNGKLTETDVYYYGQLLTVKK